MNKKRIYNILVPIILIANFMIYLLDKDARFWFAPLTLFCYSLAILFLYYSLDYIIEEEVKDGKEKTKV